MTGFSRYEIQSCRDSNGSIHITKSNACVPNVKFRQFTFLSYAQVGHSYETDRQTDRQGQRLCPCMGEDIIM